MEHLLMRGERHRVVREEQFEYHMAPPQEDPLKIMLDHFGKRAEERASADHHHNRNHHQQFGGYKGPYLQASVVNQAQHRQPPVVCRFQTSFAHPESRYQQPMPHKLETVVIHHELGNYQQPAAPRALYPQAGFGHHGDFEQPIIAPDQMTHSGVMDCKEVSKLYGGVVSIKYGSNKCRA